jgi:hypothetical protein
MRRAVLLLSLAFFSGTAMAAEVQPTLDELRTAIFKAPGRVSLSETANGTCTVTNDCNGGTPISCTSYYGNCHSGFDWVECDGNRTYCIEPACTASYVCPWWSPTYMVSCQGQYTCQVSDGQCGVFCDGLETRCAECWDH